MKKKYLVAVLGFVFIASCSNDTEISIETESTSLLKSYTVSRNSSGEYSVDYDVVANATVETIKNHTSNFNEIYLYSGKFIDKKNYTDSFSLEDNQLKITFNENNASRKSLIIEDEDIVLARGASESTEFLQSYSITDLGGNIYELSFKVRKGVDVSFSYNEVTNIYEVNLKEDVSKNISKEYSKIYRKDSRILRIDFVNYKLIENRVFENNTVSPRMSYDRGRRPRVIVSEE